MEGNVVVALLHAAWAEYCIFDQSSSVEKTLVLTSNFSDLHPLAQVSEPMKCGLAGLSKAILRRDPLGIGFDEFWGLDLLSRLLRWNPEDRISMVAAFKHAYFTGPYVSDMDGSEHGTEEDLARHNLELIMHDGELFEEVDASSAVALSGDVHSIFLGVHHESSPDKLAVAEPLEASVRRVVLEMPVELEFSCPKCGRRFTGWSSCHAHLVARGHGLRCVYNASR